MRRTLSHGALCYTWCGTPYIFSRHFKRSQLLRIWNESLLYDFYGENYCSWCHCSLSSCFLIATHNCQQNLKWNENENANENEITFDRNKIYRNGEKQQFESWKGPKRTDPDQFLGSFPLSNFFTQSILNLSIIFVLSDEKIWYKIAR
jgi:hypothetical protein